MDEAVEQLEILAREFAKDGWGPTAKIIQRRADELAYGRDITPVAKKYNKDMYKKPDKSKPKGKK